MSMFRTPGEGISWTSSVAVETTGGVRTRERAVAGEGKKAEDTGLRSTSVQRGAREEGMVER